MNTSKAPFIPIREVIMYCPNSGIWNAMTPELKQQYFMCYWPDERIRQHVALLREYADGFVGPEAAPILVRALAAVEHARCRSLRYDLKVGDPNEDLHDKPADALPADWADQGLDMARSSLEELSGLTLPPAHQPPWPVTLSPQEFLSELVAHLRAIEQMLSYLKAQGDVRRQLAKGASPEQLEAMIAALPEVTYDPAHTAGLERQAYLQHRQQLKSQCES